MGLMEEKEALKNNIVATRIIEWELERRKNYKIYSYNTGKKVHKKQIEFHKSKKRNRWVFGGNRSGKTECGAVESVWLARGIHPYRENKKDVEGWVVSLSSRVQKDVAQKKILSYIDPLWIEKIIMQSGSVLDPENGIIERIILKNVNGGKGVIAFKSCEEGREKFQGASLDFVWFDEEPPKDVYDECVMRVFDKSGDIFGTMTPLKGLTFVYDVIYLNKNQDDEVFYLFMNWEDNPYLSKSEIKRLEKTMGEDELESRKYGRFIDKSNSLVYPEFDEKINVIEPFDVPDFWQDTISIDPGLKNPLSAHWYAVDPYTNNVFVVAEHYMAEQTVDFHSAKIKEICEKLNWKQNTFGGYDALIDSASMQSTLNSPKSVARLFNERGIYVNPNVNKDLFSGLSAVKRLLKDAGGEPHLFIFKSCVNLIREIKSYRWGDGDKPVKVDDHALDELRYYCNRKTSVQKLEEEKTEIQKDKERLYKKIKADRGY